MLTSGIPPYLTVATARAYRELLQSKRWSELCKF